MRGGSFGGRRNDSQKGADNVEAVIRRRSELWEEEHLSPCACLSSKSRGRERPQEPDAIRTCFQRDRDRILHCKAFRRLSHKTQVFLSPEGDHYRTRLTHTLEVSQIARTMAVALGLNEDLAEAIALGHDLGHTPFGHAGERALNEICPGGFLHYEQSVRIARVLERDGQGLNLTWEVLDGIERHTRGEQAATLEGRLVRLADGFAYAHHDVEDAIRAGVMTEQAIPPEVRKVLGEDRSKRLDRLVSSVIKNSVDDIRMDDETDWAYHALLEFLHGAVYTNPVAKGEERKVEGLITKLYEHFSTNPEAMPAEYIRVAMRDGLDRAVCDYISGMSDRYAIKTYTDIFVPKGWSKE